MPKSKPAAEKFDLYQSVTDRIVAALESGSADPKKWKAPWHRLGLESPISIDGRGYRGLNVLLLSLAQEALGYALPVWGTFKAWQERGMMVRKGQKATVVYFWAKIVAKGDDGEPVEDDGQRRRWFARPFWVFNGDQVEGFDADAYTAKRKASLPPVEFSPILRAESCLTAYTKAEGIKVTHGGDRAFYRPSTDSITLPARKQFKTAEGYYSTFAHEAAHSTLTEGRCNRNYTGARFGDSAYAMEELVAELSAAFQMAALGMAVEPRPDHAQYLASWLQVLKSDKRAIFTAASGAQKASDLILQHDRFAAKAEAMEAAA